MRNLSAKALTKLAQRYGNEPIIIIEVAWNEDGIIPYAEREVGNIKGRILEITNLDNVITVSEGSDSQEMSVILDDTDGIIKSIIDNYDIHKCDVFVYQWFEGLDLTDRFLLFHGKISTPIIWKEGDRTITFTIITQLEDKEVGFSPEEGQFPYIPKDLVGKTWPSIFGTPLDVPAVRIGAAVTGTTLCGVGIISGQNYHDTEDLGGNPPDTREQGYRAAYLSALAEIFEEVGVKYVPFEYKPGRIKITRNEDYTDRAKEYRKQANEIRTNIANIWGQYDRAQRCARCRRTEIKEEAESKGLGCNPLTILGGEDFPRGEITLVINGGYFKGSFIGETNEFNIVKRWHPENDKQIIQNITDDKKRCPDCDSQSPEVKTILWETSVPFGHGNTSSTYSVGDREYSTRLFDIYRQEWKLYPQDTERGLMYFPKTDRGRRDTKMIQFWADAGSSVKLATDPPFNHIVSIVPGTVLQVKAFKNFHGEERLINVPSDLWIAETQQYGSITAEVVIVKQLTTIEGQEWESDNIYVTFESDIGPNIVDILEYLIATYSDLQVDNTSFDAVKTKLIPFPANFALLDRKNLVEVLQEIAFQARCSLKLSNGIFYLKYLAEEPTTVDTIIEKDIEHQSIEISLTPTEDLVTKYIATWRLSYAQEDLDKIILRHNVQKYGIQEEEYEYYLYNQPDIIHKIATFWLIRKSNSWKHIKFRTFLHKLNLETFDSVLLDFQQPYVANGSVKVLIEQADFDSANQLVIVQCWVPIKSGEMEQYEFAWPANVAADLVFPTQREVDLGLDGGNGIGKDATGELPVGDTSRVTDQSIYVGGPNVVFGGQTDRGDSHPSDVNFTAQSIGPFNIYATIIVQQRPDLNLKLNYAEDIDPGYIDTLFGGVTEINLEQTRIKSKYAPNQWNTLGEILIMEQDKPLAIKTAALFAGKDQNGVCRKSPFDFKYNNQHFVWAAGSAFLAEEEAPPLSSSQSGELLGDCE